MTLAFRPQGTSRLLRPAMTSPTGSTLRALANAEFWGATSSITQISRSLSSAGAGVGSFSSVIRSHRPFSVAGLGTLSGSSRLRLVRTVTVAGGATMTGAALSRLARAFSAAGAATSSLIGTFVGGVTQIARSFSAAGFGGLAGVVRSRLNRNLNSSGLSVFTAASRQRALARISSAGFGGVSLVASGGVQVATPLARVLRISAELRALDIPTEARRLRLTA